MVRTGAGTANAMDLYMADMTQYPLLTAEQEIALAQQYERGRVAEQQLRDSSSIGASELEALRAAVKKGEQARCCMIRCNLRLVVSMALGYAGLGLPLDDLVQEGSIGLMEAVERYDPDRGFRFATYAGWWIKQGIRRALTNKGRLVRLPAHVLQDLYRLRQTSKELESRFDRRPTSKELAENLGMRLTKIRQLLRLQRRRMLSLQMPVGDEGDSELADVIPNPNAPAMEDVYAQHHLRQSVRDVVTSRLSPREQKVVAMRFGLDGREGSTLKQIADALDLSRERVRQIEARALRRLRRGETRLKLHNAWTDI
jgi:RNA polymerase primary sigma factor